MSVSRRIGSHKYSLRVYRLERERLVARVTEKLKLSVDQPEKSTKIGGKIEGHIGAKNEGCIGPDSQNNYWAYFVN